MSWRFLPAFSGIRREFRQITVARRLHGSPPIVTPTNSEALLTLVAISLLGRGVDTFAARAFKALALPDGLVTDRFDPAASIEPLGQALGVTPAGWRDRMQRAHQVAHAALTLAARANIAAIPIHAPDYPALLRHIIDPPCVLWLKGVAAALNHRSIAIVGSRNGTPAGLMTASRLGNDLAAAGISVVSGLARGVDGAAHRGALDAAGITVAVLGCGVDRMYPREHAALAASILERGALVSEFPPGTAALPPHFPLRNRIISGLSRAVVVVEAHLKSGSLITARAALEQGRDVLAVPGNVASGCYRGSHNLIKDGARLVETVEDVLDEVGWRPVPERPAGASDKRHEFNQLDGLVEPGGTIGLDELLARTGRPVTALLAELSELELAGKIAKTAGGGFVRLD